MKSKLSGNLRGVKLNTCTISSCCQVQRSRMGSLEVSPPFSVTLPRRPLMDEVASPVRIRLQVFSTSWRFALPWDFTVLSHPDYAPGIFPSELFPSRSPCLSRGRCSPTVGVLALATARPFPAPCSNSGPYHPPVCFDLAAAAAGNQQWAETSHVAGKPTPGTMTWASPPLRSLAPPESPFTPQTRVPACQCRCSPGFLPL